VQEGQLTLMKRINSALIGGLVTGIFAGVLMAYINWESTSRQGKLTEYIASSLLFSSVITVSALTGASLGFSHDLKRKLFPQKKD
jgi:hypothetical protein